MLERLAIEHGAVLFDPRRVALPGEPLFDPAHWRALGALTEQAGGRGSVQFVDAGDRRWVLRRYLRGGMAARFAHDRYLWLGEERTRSFREMRLLAALRARDLPVPAPVAAQYRRRGLGYGAALITERLPGARTLSEALAAGGMDDALWAAIGRCLRHFHDAGVQHADLNAHNIMLGERREVWLIDFDRGRLRRPGPWCGRVLDRLARSLAKVGRGDDWQVGFALLRLAHDA
ncbi:MAG TPA: 3-deoxy-D-manno-octulosonic acid kinase [Steroidobacteraceae bacterium]|jgi:3-deoxy-D-manno-octulosonic acid kinase|nr:3-deoxy-D-manno-octulosonic acid kinase [Steroidobacteraceae bacterium]